MHSGGSMASTSSNEHSVLNNELVQVPQMPSAPIVEGSDKENFYENLVDMKKQEVQKLPEEHDSKRSVFIMRHGERVDFTFGSWVPFCFDELGNYMRKDLNMPRSLPERRGGASAYLKDSPLTNVGNFEAKLVGEALKDKNITIDHVYCSPSYRCLQTCDSLLQGLNKRDELPIKVEPGLFEWTAWYSADSFPQWMTQTEFINAGFNIDEDYVPFVAERELRETTEKCEQFYMRSAFVTRSVLSANSRGNVLLIGHTATLDTCSRDLVGKPARSTEQMSKIIQKVPYCAIIEVTGRGNDWQIVEPPCMPLTHSTNQRFDWRVLL